MSLPRLTVMGSVSAGWAEMMRWMSSKLSDGRSGDTQQSVVGPNASVCSGAVGQHTAGDWQDHRPPGGGEQHGEQHHGQQEVGDRSGRDDESARADGLLVEHPARDPAAVRCGTGWLIRGGNFGTFLAMQLHVAAERQPGQLPHRADAVAPGGDRRAEADREHLDMHADERAAR